MLFHAPIVSLTNAHQHLKGQDIQLENTHLEARNFLFAL